MSSGIPPLQVPKEWNNLKRTRAGAAKVRDVSKKRFRAETVISNNSADSAEDICRAVCHNLSK